MRNLCGVPRFSSLLFSFLIATHGLYRELRVARSSPKQICHFLSRCTSVGVAWTSSSKVAAIAALAFSCLAKVYFLNL